jgi:hypothetical protein
LNLGTLLSVKTCPWFAGSWKMAVLCPFLGFLLHARIGSAHPSSVHSSPRIVRWQQRATDVTWTSVHAGKRIHAVKPPMVEWNTFWQMIDSQLEQKWVAAVCFYVTVPAADSSPSKLVSLARSLNSSRDSQATILLRPLFVVAIALFWACAGVCSSFGDPPA